MPDKPPDPFDNLESLAAPKEEVEARLRAAESAPEKPIKTKSRRPFTIVYDDWMERLSAAKYKSTYPVMIHILRQNFKNPGQPVTVSNMMLRKWGVSRKQKERALGDLEDLGLVRVERHGKHSPVVTLSLSL